MDVAERYSTIINQINSIVDEFNVLLSDTNRLRSISSDDPATYTDAMGKPWGSQGWPSKDNTGVYFLCGYHENDEMQLGVYIGKASLKVMGHRLYSHLKPYRESGIYKRNSHDGCFIIQAILAIPIENSKASCIAAALEEYLIVRGLSGVRLLNSVGIRNGDDVITK